MNLIHIILATFVLYLIQVWLLKVVFIKNKAFLLGNRDKEPVDTLIIGRIKRAADNLKENLFPFLTLAILAIVLGRELTQIALIWLAFRVAHLMAYLIGIAQLRALFWFGSLICLILMAIELL